MEIYKLSSPGPYLAIGLACGLLYLQMKAVKKFIFPQFLKKQKSKLEDLSEFHYQKDRDSWNKVKQFVEVNLDHYQDNLSLKDLKKELNKISLSYKESRTSIRMKLDELDSMHLPNDPSLEAYKNQMKDRERNYV